MATIGLDSLTHTVMAQPGQVIGFALEVETAVPVAQAVQLDGGSVIDVHVDTQRGHRRHDPPLIGRKNQRQPTSSRNRDAACETPRIEPPTSNSRSGSVIANSAAAGTT